ncbi:ankyrin repeat domain-containing protein [Pseudorhodoferax sp.]|uniref:ankyrin repeat domain-containing protein n=1 Tax=Pseudorhodoferax sp. TaxID=1993553 RepID=UPI002DD692C1|nr:ankyrin repeat domain-containing protein [Pseudorhodoferax sp.]
MTPRLSRRLVLAWALCCGSWAHAGSYEDFFAAVAKDDASVVVSLLRRGFDPNTRDPNGQPGLYLAVRAPSPRVTQALIDWPKTDVETLNKTDESPLMAAALDGQLDLCKKLIARGAAVNKTGWTPLHYAATNGHIDVMRLLLEEHAFIDAESPNKTTPLMMAARYGSLETVRLLLQEGAEPLLKNEQGLTPIDFANAVNRGDVAKLIGDAVRQKQPKGKW